MSQKPRKNYPPSTKRLTLSQRLRRSWTLSRVRRTTKRLKKEQKRLLLMRVQMDYQLLRQLGTAALWSMWELISFWALTLMMMIFCALPCARLFWYR